METSEPGANRDTGVPTGRNTTLSIDYQQYVSITSLLSTDLGQSRRLGGRSAQESSASPATTAGGMRLVAD